jgi:hypothetical protein
MDVMSKLVARVAKSTCDVREFQVFLIFEATHAAIGGSV